MTPHKARLHSGQTPVKRRRRGFATVMALLIVVAVVAVAVSLVVGTTGQVRQADNLATAQEARLVAESGLSYLIYRLAGTQVQGGLDGRALTLAVATELRRKLDGTPNLQPGGGRIIHDPNLPTDPNDTHDPNEIIIPSILLSGTKSFSASLKLQEPTGDPNGPGSFTFRLAVTGRSRLMARTVGVDFDVATDTGGQTSPGAGGVFGFPGGIVSNGPITLVGNSRLRAVNDANEASILSATMSTGTPLTLNGNCTIDGDGYMSNPDGQASLSGNYSIGGATRWSGDIDEHIHAGVPAPELPRIDTSIFRPLAVNTVSGGSSGNKTFDNIYVPPNVNPTFAGNSKIRGVIYIAQPNNVTFAGNCDVKGVIVTEDAGDGGYLSNSVKFTGNFKVAGIDLLPDEPQFAALKAMPGSFILAPGFTMEFTGNFGTVAGYIAANKLKFTGNVSGTIYGGILNYGDTELKLTGNSNLRFDRQGYLDRVGGAAITPPGFVPTSEPCVLSVKAGSYFEQ